MHIIKGVISIVTAMVINISSLSGQEPFEKDSFITGDGTLEITFIGHGTVMISFNDYIIHIDPVSAEADYSILPDADMILVTHDHGDHLDPSAISKIIKKGTVVICNNSSASRIDNPMVMKNGETIEVDGITVEAVPAYNIVNQRSAGNPFHPRGTGNGYILGFGGKRIYIAGDTENIPEMSNFGKIDIAFLPMNLPYTMTPEMVSEAARVLNPVVLYPYHFGNTDTGRLLELLKDTAIDVRIRKME